MTRPVLAAELGTNTSYTVSSPVNPLATNRALIPSLLWSRSQRADARFLPRAVCTSTVLYTPNPASRSSLRRLLSLRIVNKRVQQFSSVFMAVCRRTLHGPHLQIPDIATPASFTLRTSICELSPRGCFACGGTSSVVGSAAHLVGVDDLIRAFGVGVGNTVDVSTTGTFAPIKVCG